MLPGAVRPKDPYKREATRFLRGAPLTEYGHWEIAVSVQPQDRHNRVMVTLKRKARQRFQSDH